MRCGLLTDLTECFFFSFSGFSFSFSKVIPLKKKNAQCSVKKRQNTNEKKDLILILESSMVIDH